jgi:hypothetical protein
MSAFSKNFLEEGMEEDVENQDLLDFRENSQFRG